MTLDKVRKFILQNSPKSGQEILDFIDKVEVIIGFNGTHYYKNGKLHREDGPASEYKNGTKFWYLNGKLHRINGPAVEWSNGDKAWWKNDKLHRTDGPAIEYGGIKQWHLNGECLTKEEFNKQQNH